MRSARFDRPVQIWWSRRRSRFLLVAVLLPFLAVGPLLTAVGFEEPPRSVWVVLPLAIALGALQLRHSFAAARGVLPRHWPITLLAVGILVYVPLFWYQWDWATTQWMFITSVVMLLHGRVMKVLIALPLLGTPIAAVISQSVVEGPDLSELSTSSSTGRSSWLGAPPASTAPLNWCGRWTPFSRREVRWPRWPSEPSACESARDLHDLLGQSLSAVSLKGDLAIALLQSDPPAAETEIRGLTEVAREALRDIRHVVHDEHQVTLQSETKGAAVLLAAASISADIDVQLQKSCHLRSISCSVGLCARVSRTCSAIAKRQPAQSRPLVRSELRVLVIVNDGARSTAESGTGIEGLIERAQSLSGHVEGVVMPDGQYRLTVEVPEAFG